jgi:DNA polymerase III epsilon subunit family exonuclease
MSLDLFSGLPNPLLARPYVVIDFETTGLYPAMGDEICEVGAVRVENGVSVREYCRLVNPGKPMDPAAVQVSGITPEMLAVEPLLEAVVADFLPLFDGAVIVAHNAEFDMGFLQYKLVRMGRPQLGNPVLDTLELARAEDETGPYTLGVLAAKLGIEEPSLHRALPDARVTVRVLLHFLEQCHRQGRDDLTKLPGYRTSYQFSIDGPGRGKENTFQIVVDQIRHAIDIGCDLEISYRGGKGISSRRVTPRLIKGMNVRAHCHVRNEERDFRLDRILECEEIHEGVKQS